jgi:3-oxoacyl-[acyl-carrier-protein] synthase-3
MNSDTAWLAATAVRLPQKTQSAAAVNEALGRPSGWLERHAGIEKRYVWDAEDPLAAAAAAGRECLERARLSASEVGALLVTSEAPPLLMGLAAAMHGRLQLGPQTVALEIGNACTGFLAAIWTAQRLLPRTGAVLLVAVEAPTRYLLLKPGAAGKGASLFSDGAAAAVLVEHPVGTEPVSVGEVYLGVNGDLGRLLVLERSAAGDVELHMKEVELADRAIHVMAQTVTDMVKQHGLSVAELSAVVVHGGNGRMPALLARVLRVPADRVWSEAPRVGNLGSASLPVAWAVPQTRPKGPVVWTAVGAGLSWGSVLVNGSFARSIV